MATIITVQGSYRVMEFPEAAAQTFKAFQDICTITSSGTINQLIAAGSDLASTAIERGIVIPIEDATGTTANMVQCIVFDDDTRILLPVEHGTDASAVTAASQRGATFCLTNSSATPAGWAVAIDNTTNPICRIEQIDLSSAVGTQYGKLKVSLLDTCRYPIK